MNPRANHSGARATCQLRGLFLEIVTGQLLDYQPSIVAGVNLIYV